MTILFDLFLKGVLSFGFKLLTSVASEKVIEWTFFKLADSISKSTSTVHDDEWVSKVKEVYKEVNK